MADDLDLDVLERLAKTYTREVDRMEMRPVDVLALIQRLREAEAENRNLMIVKQANEVAEVDPTGAAKTFSRSIAYLETRIAQLERVREAADITVTLAEQNDYGADEAEEIKLWELRAALVAVEEKP